MAKNTDEKLSILEAVKAFAKDDISKAGINLFTVLGVPMFSPQGIKKLATVSERHISTIPKNSGKLFRSRVFPQMPEPHGFG